uniref:C3H1-type domain-containing protein n=1 Tax=Karlodinium veneficum TaxID=407301 RepID=E8Z6Y6_KARVE|nr:unknown [Karlodinium veneficum]
MEHSLDDQMMRLAESQLQQQATQERRARKRGWDVEPEPSSMPQTAPGAPMPGSMEAQLRSMGAQLPGITAGVVPNGGPPGMSPPGMSPPGMASSGMGPGGGLPSNFAIASVPNSLSGMMHGGMGGMQQRPGPPIPGVDGNWTCPQCAHVNFGLEKIVRNAARTHLEEASLVVVTMPSTQQQDLLTVCSALEKESISDKLSEGCLCFPKGCKCDELQGNLQSLIDDYADKAFQQLASAIGDRIGTSSRSHLVLNVLVNSASTQGFSTRRDLSALRTWFYCYDRFFLRDASHGFAVGIYKGACGWQEDSNKVYALLRQLEMNLSGHSLGRLQIHRTQSPTIEKVQRFVSRWIGGTVDQIAKAHQGDPHTALPSNIASAMFQHLLDSGTMPIFLTRELQTQGIQVPSPYPDLDGVVTTAYQPYAARAVKRQRTQQTFQMPMAKTAYCFYHYNGSCGFGAQCRYAHSEMELPPHLWLCAPWSNDPAAW